MVSIFYLVYEAGLHVSIDFVGVYERKRLKNFLNLSYTTPKVVTAFYFININKVNHLPSNLNKFFLFCLRKDKVKKGIAMKLEIFAKPVACRR